MKQLFIKALNKLFNFEDKELIIQIGLWFSESIKSELRKTERCAFGKQQLLLLISKEFRVDLSDKQLIKVLEESRLHLYQVGISLYADNGGIVAGKPMREVVAA